MRAIRVLVLVAVVAGLAGCGGSSKKSSSSSSSPGISAAAPDTVTIRGFAFGPKTVTVAPGAIVSVINADSVTHTVTSDDKTSFNTNHVGGGASTTFVAPTAPGTYTYHCSIHTYMKGTIVVH